MANDARLLLLACSQRKRIDSGLLPAIERYDGPLFRVLRRFLNAHLPPPYGISVFILSAEFGLITSTKMIPYYDRRMTPARADELRDDVHTGLKQILTSQHPPYRKMLVCMGEDYLRTLSGWETWRPANLDVEFASGSPGSMVARLYDWLYQGPPSLDYEQTGRAYLRGTEIRMPPREVMDIARRLLGEGSGEPYNYRAWYVTIDGQRVAPKWLVSQLTGLPVGAFTTSEANRVLVQLGIEVKRV